MSHVPISLQASPYPMPMTVVSALVDGRVNHLAVAWVTRVNASPPLIAVALGRRHHTNRGILEHKEFGLSIPPSSAMEAVDHVGLVSGSRHDKSLVFPVFFSKLAHAPLIASFPLVMGCRVLEVKALPTNDLFIAEIVEALALPDALTEGVPDIAKMTPFTLTMPDNRYFEVGECIGRAWKAGKNFVPR